MKYYIGIKNDKVVANWGGQTLLNTEQIANICSGDPDKIIEIETANAIKLGFPLALYDSNWELLPKNQWEKLGYDEEGQPLPTKAELEAEAEQQAQQAELSNLQRREHLAKSFVDREEAAAEQEAIAELVSKRKAELLAASPKALYVQKAQENRAKFEADLQALAEPDET